jgi:cellulose synthase/poly-beta-1,6-N-acetylglucosamine synthase-like glycosyltransferase
MATVLVTIGCLQLLFLLVFCFFGFFNYLYSLASLFRSRIRSKPNSQPRVAVVIVCRNEKHVIEATIAASDRLTYRNRCLVVADDSDDPEMIASLRALARRRGCRQVRGACKRESNAERETSGSRPAGIPEVEIWKSSNFVLLHRPVNEGFKAGSLKRVQHFLRGEGIDLMYLLDADWAPQSDALERCLDVMEAHPQAAFVQTRRLSRREGLNAFQHAIASIEEGCYLVDLRGRQALGHPILFTGCCALLRLDAIESVGGFTPGHLTEDIDLSSRLWAAGWKGIYLHRVVNYGELPFNYRDFGRQHERWAAGSARSLREHFWSLLRSPHLSLLQKLSAIRQNAYFTSGVFTAGTIVTAMFMVVLLHWRGGDYAVERYAVTVQEHRRLLGAVIAACLCSNFLQPILTAIRSRSLADLSQLPLTTWYSWSLLPTYVHANLKGLLGIPMNWFKTPKYVRGSPESSVRQHPWPKAPRIALVCLMLCFYFFEGFTTERLDLFAFLWLPAFLLTIRG